MPSPRNSASLPLWAMPGPGEKLTSLTCRRSTRASLQGPLCREGSGALALASAAVCSRVRAHVYTLLAQTPSTITSAACGNCQAWACLIKTNQAANYSDFTHRFQVLAGHISPLPHPSADHFQPAPLSPPGPREGAFAALSQQCCGKETEGELWGEAVQGTRLGPDCAMEIHGCFIGEPVP